MKKIVTFILVTFLVIMQLPIIGNAQVPTASVEAIKFAKAPTIDGVISASEWGEPTLENVVHGNPEQAYRDPNGIESITWSAWFRWDEDNFYVAVQTPDTNNVNVNHDGLMWDGDALQMKIDPLGNWETQEKSDFDFTSGNLREVIYSYNSNDSKTQSWCFTIGGEAKGEAVVLNADGMTTYEVSIPWSYFEVNPPTSNQTIGMALCVLSCDFVSYNGWLEWGSGTVTRTDEFRPGTNKVVLSETKFQPEEPYPTFSPKVIPKPSKNILIPVIIGVAAIVILGIIVIVVKKTKDKQKKI